MLSNLEIIGWKKKFRGQPKLDEAAGQVQFGCQRNFLNPIIFKLDKHVVLLLINYITREVIQICKENYSNCLWRKTDWALDLPKLGKASKISGDLRWSPEIVFGKILGSVRVIFGNLRKCSDDLRKYSSDLWKSSEKFGWYSKIFGNVRVFFGSLWNCSGDLRKSSEVSGDLRKSSGVFGRSSEIFGRFRVAFDNLRKVKAFKFHWLRQTVLFFPNWTVSAFLLSP